MQTHRGSGNYNANYKFPKSDIYIVSCDCKLKISEKKNPKSDIRKVEILGITLEIIHAKFHKSRVNIVAANCKYPKKFKTG